MNGTLHPEPSVSESQAKRILIVRHEGPAFCIRMSKVIATMLDCGWECDVLMRRSSVAEINVAREMGRDLSTEVEIFKVRSSRRRITAYKKMISGQFLFGTRRFKRQLARLLSCRPYRLIWVKDSPCLALVFRSLQRAARAETRVVCDIYENALPYTYDRRVRYGTWRARLLTRAQRLLPRLEAAERTFLPKCDHVFVVVEETKGFLLDAYGLDPSRVSVVHNVEILDEFDSIQPGPPLAAGVALMSYVGGIAPHRGIEVLIEAVRIVAARPHSSFQLAIVGARDRQVEPLRARCKAKGVDDIVRVIPWVPHRVAMEWMKQSDVGIIPHADTAHIRTTIPNKLFQYMAAGVPCVVSDVGPLGRIVRETGCGCTFRPGSAEALAETVAFALSHRDELRAMGTRGRLAAQRWYRWEIEGQAYADYLTSFQGTGL